jgi:hypothetical protein
MPRHLKYVLLSTWQCSQTCHKYYPCRLLLKVFRLFLSFFSLYIGSGFLPLVRRTSLLTATCASVFTQDEVRTIDVTDAWKWLSAAGLTVSEQGTQGR